MNDAENEDKVEHKGQSRRLRPFERVGVLLLGLIQERCLLYVENVEKSL